MAGQKSGKAPGKTPYAPGGAEVWSDSDRDYFDDRLFHRESSIDQSQQQAKDVDRLYKEKNPGFAKGGIVGPNRLKWGSPKVSAPCVDTKTLKCY